VRSILERGRVAIPKRNCHVSHRIRPTRFRRRTGATDPVTHDSSSSGIATRPRSRMLRTGLEMPQRANSPAAASRRRGCNPNDVSVPEPRRDCKSGSEKVTASRVGRLLRPARRMLLSESVAGAEVLRSPGFRSRPGLRCTSASAIPSSFIRAGLNRRRPRMSSRCVAEVTRLPAAAGPCPEVGRLPLRRTDSGTPP